MFTQIDRIIPHGPPMVMIDAYTRISQDRGQGQKTYSPDDYASFDGRVNTAFLIESTAQTVAAHQGYRNLDSPEDPPKPGLLVSVDRFDIFHPVRAGETVTIDITLNGDIGNFTLITGELHCGETLVAQGKLKIFTPEGETP